MVNGCHASGLLFHLALPAGFTFARGAGLNHSFPFLDGFPLQFVQCAETAGSKTGFHAQFVGWILNAYEEQ